ncbi:MAG: PAS domain S-box protein [Deltaproteobacteria bacterium]|nr:PAS domain S-box protein [Deltaproteobacteria bacterium]
MEIVNEGQLPLYVHIDGMAVATGNGLQIRIAVVDVTERKQAEDVLRALEMKYRRLLENLQGVYFETTLAGVIQEVSPSISGVFGFPREEVIGKSIMDFYANSFHRDLHLDMILKNGKVTNYETEFIYKGGTHHWVSITSTLLFQSDGAPYGIIGSIRDVTDRKQKEMELQIKDSAISTSIYGIAFVDLDGKIIYVNPSFIDMWGYDAEKDVIDRPLNDIFQTDQPVLNIADYLLEKGNKGAEMTAVRNDHSLFTAQVSASLIKDTTGNPLCINVSFLDISVRKEMEDIMIRQEKLSSLGQLSAGLAHELRNPLAVISSCAQFSIENLSMGRLVKENLQMIYRNSQRASNLINNLLAFSRPSDLAQRLLNINDMFLRMADMARLETTPCRIEFENQLAPDLPLVTGDEDKLGQVFLNILINAIQAVGGKGKIIMKTAFQPNRRQVEAAVIDNGPGIPEEYRQRIFDPFFTTKDGGTGLGLSISFSIIQQHNGTIVAEPNTGGGTRISVMLPATFQSVDRKETNHAD